MKIEFGFAGIDETIAVDNYEDIINIYNSIGGKAKVKPVFCVDGNIYKLSNTDMPINNLVIFLMGVLNTGGVPIEVIRKYIQEQGHKN